MLSGCPIVPSHDVLFSARPHRPRMQLRAADLLLHRLLLLFFFSFSFSSFSFSSFSFFFLSSSSSSLLLLPHPIPSSSLSLLSFVPTSASLLSLLLPPLLSLLILPSYVTHCSRLRTTTTTMSAPAQPAVSVGPNTPITIKVLYDGNTRRFKILLRDLNAQVLPQKVWLSLSPLQLRPALLVLLHNTTLAGPILPLPLVIIMSTSFPS